VILGVQILLGGIVHAAVQPNIQRLVDEVRDGKLDFAYLAPIGFAVTVPAQAMTARLHRPTVLVALGFAAVLAGFTRWFWRFGLRRYSGASA